MGAAKDLSPGLPLSHSCHLSIARHSGKILFVILLGKISGNAFDI